MSITGTNIEGVWTMAMKNQLHPGCIVRRQCLEPLGLSVTRAADNLGVKHKLFPISSTGIRISRLIWAFTCRELLTCVFMPAGVQLRLVLLQRAQPPVAGRDHGIESPFEEGRAVCRQGRRKGGCAPRGATKEALRGRVPRLGIGAYVIASINRPDTRKRLTKCPGLPKE